MLTEEEMLRLMRLDLYPEEAKQLIQTHGVFHEVHDDFYCPETFVAFQPRGIASEGGAPKISQAV